MTAGTIPQHLAGRLFAVVVHGDTKGAEGVRRSLADWLRATGLVPAGPMAEVDRYIGYWQPYATSHEELDRDRAIQDEVRNAARTLLEAVQATRVRPAGQRRAAASIGTSPEMTASATCWRAHGPVRRPSPPLHSLAAGTSGPPPAIGTSPVAIPLA